MLLYRDGQINHHLLSLNIYLLAKKPWRCKWQDSRLRKRKKIYTQTKEGTSNKLLVGLRRNILKEMKIFALKELQRIKTVVENSKESVTIVGTRDTIGIRNSLLQVT